MFGCIDVSNFSPTKGIYISLYGWWPMTMASFSYDFSNRTGIFLRHKMLLINGFIAVIFSEILEKHAKKLNHQRLMRSLMFMLHAVAILISFFYVGKVNRLKPFRVRPSLLLKKWSLHGLNLHYQQFSLDTRFKIFTADELGLFYRCVSNKTNHFKNGKCTVGKHSNVCWTGIAAVNVNGDRLPMFVIGKSKTPKSWRCEKRSMSLSGKTKSWILSELFEELFKEIDQNVGAQNRNIAFIIDNCPAHQKYQHLIRGNWSLFFRIPRRLPSLWIKKSSDLL